MVLQIVSQRHLAMSFSQSDWFNMTLETRIKRFSDDKCRAIMLDMGDQEVWRETIRKQLETELEARVHEVLASQFALRRSNRLNQKVDLASQRQSSLDATMDQDPVTAANDSLEMKEKEKEYNKTQDWRASEMRRRIHEIMKESDKELLRPCYGKQHSTVLLNHLSQTNHDRLMKFLVALNESKDPVIKARSYYTDINEQALTDFGGLSVSERHSFFYPFTRAGFQEAVKTGMLPDGSALIEVEPGLYRDNLGIIRTKDGPFWPVDSGPMLPAPVHKRFLHQVVEPLQKSLAVSRECSLQSSAVEWQGQHQRQLERQGQQQQEQQSQQQLVQLDGTVDRYLKYQEHHQSTNVRQQGPQHQLQSQLEEHQSVRFPGKWRGVMVVFDSEKFPRNYSPPASPDCHCPSLIFESRFESGNLRQARRVGQFEYELLLSTDMYTKRHVQWYYFQVQNALPNVIYTFKIINLLKRHSLYACGMQPLFYSEHLSKTKDIGWIRTGHHISYRRNLNNLQCPLLSRERNYYVLEWQMDFPSADDTCFLAHCYPYTFTDLRQDLSHLLGEDERSKFMKLDVLCQTKAGNSCFLVTVAENPLETEGDTEKQGIVVTARVHPGETNSSWIMRGLLHHITGSSASAKELRKNFIFKIVPMINPDGVIIGNYRCCLSGRDLNRNYRKPNRDAFPVVWHIKEMIAKLRSSTPILLYCDIHGHSRKQNVFMYGCAADQDRYTDDENPIAYLRHRLFPWLMARRCPDKFSYPGCKFQVHRCKESTGRVVMYRQLSIKNSYTLEATFCGTTICKEDRKHLNILDFEEMGKVLCEVALEYRKTQENIGLESKALHEMMKYLMETVILQTNSTLKKDSRFSVELNLTDEQNKFSKADGKNIADMNAANENSNSMGYNLASLDSLESCIDLSRRMSLTQHLKESDSSDSDSESEPEYISTKSRLRQRKRKKRSKGQKSDVKQVGEGEVKVTDLLNNQDVVARQNFATQFDSGLPMINSHELEIRSRKLRRKKQVGCPDADQMVIHRRMLRSYPQFVNKYEGRSNGGIPCFSEERILYRAAKRTAELQQKKSDKEQRIEEGEEEEFYPNYPIAFRSYSQSRLYCVCNRLLSVLSHPSSSSNRLLQERVTILNESLAEGINLREKRDSLVLLCSQCGLPHRPNMSAKCHNTLYLDNASSFQHKFHPVTSSSDRYQTRFDLNSPFDVTSCATNRFKPDYGSMSLSNHIRVEPDDIKHDNQACLSSFMSKEKSGKSSKSLFLGDEQQLAPAVFQMPIIKH